MLSVTTAKQTSERPTLYVDHSLQKPIRMSTSGIVGSVDWRGRRLGQWSANLGQPTRLLCRVSSRQLAALFDQLFDRALPRYVAVRQLDRVEPGRLR